MDSVVVEFINKNTQFKIELEVPLFITANDLIFALNNAYDLGLNSEDFFEYYLCAENPIAFLRGEKTLADFGIRNGSVIIFKR